MRQTHDHALLVSLIREDPSLFKYKRQLIARYNGRTGLNLSWYYLQMIIKRKPELFAEFREKPEA